LNYGASEVVTISMTIRFDNAVQTPTESTGPNAAFGIGVNVGRNIGTNVSGIGQA
jgi:hypothetical protein